MSNKFHNSKNNNFDGLGTWNEIMLVVETGV